MPHSNGKLAFLTLWTIRYRSGSSRYAASMRVKHCMSCTRSMSSVAFTGMPSNSRLTAAPRTPLERFVRSLVCSLARSRRTSLLLASADRFVALCDKPIEQGRHLGRVLVANVCVLQDLVDTLDAAKLLERPNERAFLLYTHKWERSGRVGGLVAAQMAASTLGT